MKTQGQLKNQQAINEFFEAFGADTAKEYSTSIFDLLTIVSTHTNTSCEFKEDLSFKLKDLNRLILQLEKTEAVHAMPIVGVDQIN